MIKLYHYSDRDFKGYIKPDFFGENNYSGNSKKLSGIKRAYFYLDRNGKEYYFNGVKYCYITEVSKNKLYDITQDKKGILKNLRSSQDIFEQVKKKGYIGLIGSNGIACAVLFKAVKIKYRKTLTKGI
jgi:glutaredoxin-related protein